MMRIKEAIQRRKLIQQLNDEYAAIEDDTNINSKNSATTLLGGPITNARQNALSCILQKKACGNQQNAGDTNLSDQDIAYLKLYEFVNQLSQRLSDGHRRALRVTWKRLSEPPKTSGRGTLQIMEKIFDQALFGDSETMSVFYRSAFLKCIEERRTGRSSGTIATVRDHAHLLIDLIDGIMSVMFDTPFNKPVWDPATIGRAHAKYIPMGFDLSVWQKLGECFAEVMFSQECVRAYPHAASAWSMLSVAITEKMYSNSKYVKHSDRAHAGICYTTCLNQSMPQRQASNGSIKHQRNSTSPNKKNLQKAIVERRRALIHEHESSSSLEVAPIKPNSDSLKQKRSAAFRRQASIPMQGPASTFFTVQIPIDGNHQTNEIIFPRNKSRSSSFNTKNINKVKEQIKLKTNIDSDDSLEKCPKSLLRQIPNPKSKKPATISRQNHFSTSGESTDV